MVFHPPRHRFGAAVDLAASRRDGGGAMIDATPPPAIAAPFRCHAAAVQHDGDNLRCIGIGARLRMVSIDAPEVAGSYACRPDKAAHHDCRFDAGERARLAWQAIVGDRWLDCVTLGSARYGRWAVSCRLNGMNVECAMVAGGWAVARYAPLDCTRG